MYHPDRNDTSTFGLKAGEARIMVRTDRLRRMKMIPIRHMALLLAAFITDLLENSG